MKKFMFIVFIERRCMLSIVNFSVNNVHFRQSLITLFRVALVCFMVLFYNYLYVLSNEEVRLKLNIVLSGLVYLFLCICAVLLLINYKCMQ